MGNRNRVLPDLVANVKNIKLDSAGKHTKNALNQVQTARMLAGDGQSLTDLRDRAMIAAAAASCALRRTEL